MAEDNKASWSLGDATRGGEEHRGAKRSDSVGGVSYAHPPRATGLSSCDPTSTPTGLLSRATI